MALVFSTFSDERTTQFGFLLNIGNVPAGALIMLASDLNVDGDNAGNSWDNFNNFGSNSNFATSGLDGSASGQGVTFGASPLILDLQNGHDFGVPVLFRTIGIIVQNIKDGMPWGTGPSLDGAAFDNAGDAHVTFPDTASSLTTGPPFDTVGDHEIVIAFIGIQDHSITPSVGDDFTQLLAVGGKGLAIKELLAPTSGITSKWNFSSTGEATNFAYSFRIQDPTPPVASAMKTIFFLEGEN